MLSEQLLLTFDLQEQTSELFGSLPLIFIHSYFFCPFIFFCNSILTLIQFQICEAAKEVSLFNAAEICYKSSFVDTILKDVVSMPSVSFILLLHKIVFQVNKLLAGHESDWQHLIVLFMG